MMIGIRTVNDVIEKGYLWLSWFWIVGFSVYDIRYRRVPDRALFIFLVYAFWRPFIEMKITGQTALSAFGSSLAGAATGFLIMLFAAVISGRKNGVGGGDIKLTAVIGYLYGAYRLGGILVTASLLAVLWSTLRKRTVSVPFVPFLAAGSFLMMFAT